jgi:hypothetical protein
MSNIGYSKINGPEERTSNWERFKAWRSIRQNNIKRFQTSSAALASDFISINLGQSRGLADLAARSATSRILDKTA